MTKLFSVLVTVFLAGTAIAAESSTSIKLFSCALNGDVSNTSVIHVYVPMEEARRIRSEVGWTVFERMTVMKTGEITVAGAIAFGREPATEFLVKGTYEYNENKIAVHVAEFNETFIYKRKSDGRFELSIDEDVLFCTGAPAFDQSR